MSSARDRSAKQRERDEKQRRRSLQQIESDDWGDPPRDATHLVATVHKLRREPVGELGAEGLRMLIGQQIGLPVLMPLAIEVLERDPLAQGDFYPGDLLMVAVRAPADFWQRNPHLADRLREVTGSVDLTDLDASARREIEGFRSSAY